VDQKHLGKKMPESLPISLTPFWEKDLNNIGMFHK
jgi:hypothetical protein